MVFNYYDLHQLVCVSVYLTLCKKHSYWYRRTVTINIIILPKATSRKEIITSSQRHNEDLPELNYMVWLHGYCNIRYLMYYIWF